MRIIVTGGAGFVGTNLVKRLMVEGHEVTSLDNYSTGKKENEQQGCKYITGDIKVHMLGQNMLVNNYVNYSLQLSG